MSETGDQRPVPMADDLDDLDDLRDALEERGRDLPLDSTTWDDCWWTCPDCETRLHLLDSTRADGPYVGGSQYPAFPIGRARIPAVLCFECEQVFVVRFEPLDVGEDEQVGRFTGRIDDADA